MSVLKAVVSFYRTGEERPIERYKARLKVQEEHRTLSTFKKNVIDFLGLNEQARKFGLGSFDLKLYRLAKISGKIENYSLSTQQQLDLELPLLLDSDSESELNRSTLKVMNFVLRCRVARNFCGTFILRIAETKLAPQTFGELTVSIAKVWFSCWGLIFVIFRRSCARNTGKASSRDVTVCKTRCR